ncbi:hypothetical protein QYE76_046208 [Lolium multiflorum]|uniref:F-box domain-containing protein n=1 Tax=Lolium multiflorum TaxID=4521 RepID=A0AAD8TMI9_LOLMU|nr:hypothetical protein QYE76_046208 [Lolium multiflorum]
MDSGGPDLISALPDELIHHVLSFLRAHEVVRTCALARRWRELWRSAPALRVTGAKGCKNSGWFINFVRHLLQRRDASAHLDSFELDLDERDFDFNKPFLPANEWHVNGWFQLAVACGPRVLLALRTTSAIYENPDDYKTLELLNLPLISRHITRLELQMVSVRGRTLNFSGCPALVDLRMEECDIMGNIFSPSLKRLSIISGYFRTDPFRARICLPSLVSLELIGAMRRAPVLCESMPLLVSAIVRLDSTCVDSCPKNDYGDCHNRQCYACYGAGAYDRRGQSVLLNGLSEAAELELSVDSQVFVINRDLKFCPTFSKLKTLLLSEWCPSIASDLNVLSCFLQHSPVLEKLTLQLSQVPKVPVETQRSYIPSKQYFTFSHLKLVEIKCNEDDERARKVLNILSTYGIPLKKVNISR